MGYLEMSFAVSFLGKLMKLLKSMILAIVCANPVLAWSSYYIDMTSDTDGYVIYEPNISKITQAEEIRARFNLYISSKKIALERLEKYGFMAMKDSKKHFCYLEEQVFGCSFTPNDYYFTMKGDVFTKVYYSFEASNRRMRSRGLTLTQTEQDELINILNMVTDNPQESTKIFNDLIQDYQQRASNPRFDGSAFVNYQGVVIELRGHDQAFYYLFIN